MNPKPHLLIICGKNKRRSRTGEFIFKNDTRFHVRSAGLSPKSDRKISDWADLVFVMEGDHRAKIRDLYKHLNLPAIEVLHIPDEYDFMDEELIDLLTDRINQSLKSRYGI
jgi:protein-tyrosine phosphatase